MLILYSSLIHVSREALPVMLLQCSGEFVLLRYQGLLTPRHTTHLVILVQQTLHFVHLTFNINKKYNDNVNKTTNVWKSVARSRKWSPSALVTTICFRRVDQCRKKQERHVLQFSPAYSTTKR